MYEIIDFSNFDINKLILSKSITINNNKKKISIGYDNNDKLIAIGKLNNDVKKNTNQLFTVELDMDF